MTFGVLPSPAFMHGRPAEMSGVARNLAWQVQKPATGLVQLAKSLLQRPAGQITPMNVRVAVACCASTMCITPAEVTVRQVVSAKDWNNT